MATSEILMPANFPHFSGPSAKRSAGAPTFGDSAGTFGRTVSRNDTEQGLLDAKAVAATLSGDRDAFGQLVQTYQRRVFALCYRYVRNQDEAADLAQRAFLKAFESLDKLKRGQAFAAWIFRIAANLAKNKIRFHSNKSFQDVDDTPLSVSPDHERDIDRAAQRAAMRKALEKLPGKQKQCVMLRIDAELSFREIGDVVGCSEASARVNFHHGLKALRQALSTDA